MTKEYLSILRTKMSSLKFTLRKIDETRNFLLDEIKHNDLMNERYRKTGKYLNYVELFISFWYNEFCSRNKYLCNYCKN